MNRFINSLRGKIIIILGLSCLILAVLGAFSLYRTTQFQQTTRQIEIESSRLLSDIRRNLKNMELIGKIDSDINAYMLSGNPRTFDAIKGSLRHLREELPQGLQKETSILLRDMDTLALRMEGLKLNQKEVVEAENKAIKIFREAHVTCKTKERCQQFIGRLDLLFLEYRKHSFAALSAQGRNFMAEQKKSNSIIDDCLKILSGAAKETVIHPDILSRLTNVFYDLSESFETIILIREKVWRTKGKLTGLLRKISIELDKGSGNLVRQTKNRTKEDFELAEQTSTVMLWSLAACGILLAIFGVFLTNYIINPLNRLGKVLVKLSGFLVEHRDPDHKTQGYGQLISAMSSRRRDEIGYVTRAAKGLAVRVHDLSLFRRAIEADESAGAIYRRLAGIFSDRLGLRKFFIMETSEDNEGMELVICQPGELADEVPVFSSAQTCRAIQTAFPVNSFESPEICPVFPFSGNIRHICIPMVINRQAIGVVSFLFDQTPNDKIAPETGSISDTILHAVNYLNEALPLIQAKRYANMLKSMALRDQLTGLFNRRYLDNYMDMLVAGAKRRESFIGLLMCDIDYFKQVNDRYGHDAGDAVLKQLANLLRTSVRASDIVIRFGGEEFLILLNDCTEEMETRIAEKIRAAVAEHTFRVPGAAIKRTVSIGTSLFPCEGAKGIWEAIKFADMALYKAKELGRNKVFRFDHSL